MKTILVDAVNTLIVDQSVYQPLLDLLETYPNPKIILTNANDNQIEEFGLTNLPYDLFTLKHNPDKTDPEYFYKMLTHFNLTPEDTVYFEHNPKAVESAKSIRIDCYQYDPNQKDIQALKTFLDSKLTN